MFKPTIDDILNLLEERARLFIGWTKEDEIQFMKKFTNSVKSWKIIDLMNL